MDRDYQKITRVFIGVIIAIFMSVAMFSAPSANAGLWDKAKKAAKKTTKAVKKTTKKVVKKTVDTGKKAASATKKGVKKGVDAVKTGAKKTGEFITGTTDKAGDAVVKGSKITYGEMQKIGDKTKETWKDGIKLAEKGYNATAKKFNEIKQDVLIPIYKKAGKAAIKTNEKFIKALKKNMDNLDKAGMDARDRIIRAIPAKKITKKLREDMKLLGEKLGLVTGKANSIIPKKVKKSSWGIYGNISAGAVAGAEIGPAVIMNTFVEKGKYPVGLAIGGAGSIGLQGGGSGQIGLFWAPCKVDETSGASAGIGFEAAAGPGVAVGVSWVVNKNMFKKAVNAIPGFNLGWSAGVKAKVGAVSLGYTQLIKTFK